MLTILATIILAIAAITLFAMMPGSAHATWSKRLANEPDPDQGLRTLPKPRFPTIEGRNINGHRFDLPREFEGLYNIALISYSDLQQSDANEWLHALINIEDSYPYIRAYHLQVAGEMSWIGRERRDFQMSSDTTDPQTRTDTITLYTDASDFNGTLNVPDRSEITIALVDSFGNVMWRDRGRYTEAKIENLEYSIINHLANVRIYAEN